MKRFLYILCVTISLAGMNACKKAADPEPIPPVVGKWASDYLLISGLVAPYASSNGRKINPLVYGISDVYDIKSDKTFVVTDRSTAVIQSFPGTWDYTGTELNLKYDAGDSEKLTYDAPSSGSPSLLFPVAAVQDTLVNPTTQKKELVKFNLQLVYSKQ